MPLADLQACVLDTNGESVPVGVPGELVVSGAGVVRGYLRRPELTALRFVRHPAAPAHSAYRTGDLVRRLPSGALEYLGRIDDQVKIRGFRVEPGEGEAALVQHPQVREAAVLAVTDGGGARRCAGCVAPGVDGRGRGRPAVLGADAAVDATGPVFTERAPAPAVSGVPVREAARAAVAAAWRTSAAA